MHNAVSDYENRVYRAGSIRVNKVTVGLDTFVSQLVEN